MTADVVFLLDVDNTLVDNDRIVADLREHLEHEFGAASAAHYWSDFEALRAELGYVDYLGALQRYRLDIERSAPDAQRLLLVSSFLIDYPFAERVYPRVFDAIAHLGRFGPTVILSDGDVVFQPRKVRRSGLWDAVGYALDPLEIAKYPGADFSIDRIGDLADVNVAKLIQLKEKA